MKQIATVVLLLSVIISSTIYSQDAVSKIHHNLKLVLMNTPANELVDVYAVLSEQYPTDQLRQQTFYLSRKERQAEVVRLLKDFARPRQQNVINYLKQAENENRAYNIRSLWALNTVVFSATPDVIYNLAENFEEISEIRYEAKYNYEMLRDITEPIVPIENSDNGGDNTMLAPQPGLILINAPAVWAEGDSGQGILVGNLDDGCDWDHPDLINNIYNNLGEDADNDGHTLEWNGSAWVFDPGDINAVDDDGNGYVDDFIGWDFQSNDNNVYNPSSSHGTSTSGIVCGDGTNGTQTGVAPRAKLLPTRPNGEAQYWLAEQYLMDMGVDIMTSSLSYKWYFSPQPNYPMFRQMTDIELAAGIFHSNSTSNDGGNSSAPIPYNISAPGNCPPAWLHPDQTLIGGLSSITGVGNVNATTDIIVNSSPYGPSAWEDIQANHPSYPYPMPIAYQDYPYETSPGSIGLLKPDVSAPGAGTVSTINGTGYGSFSGTSGATPHVGGTFALMLSINPFLTPEDASRIIQVTSVEKGAPGKDPRYGAGRIDAYEAYLLAESEIPVELTSFTAEASEGDVILNWITQTELNNSGFNIEKRNADTQSWNTIGFVPGHGTTTERNIYSFTDNDVKMGIYNYRIKQIDFDGSFEYSEIVQVEVYSPVEFRLSQNFPNPFNPNTVIEFSVPQLSKVTLQVYSVLGELISTPVDKILEAGYHRVDFFGTNLPSGTYVYQLKAVSGNKTFVESRKMVLLK